MGQLLKKLCAKVPEEYVDAHYIPTFFRLNFGIAMETILEMDEFAIPSKSFDPEFYVIIKEHLTNRPGIMLVQFGLEYKGEEYFERIPLKIFNYFCYLVGQEENIKFADYKQLYDYVHCKKHIEPPAPPTRNGLAALAQVCREKLEAYPPEGLLMFGGAGDLDDYPDEFGDDFKNDYKDDDDRL